MAQGPTIDISARDARFFRAAKDVLKRYKIEQVDPEGEHLCFEVVGGSNPYLVKVQPEWKRAPSCTCPDAAFRANRQAGGYCKHIIAVLLSNEDLQYQLLDVFL